MNEGISRHEHRRSHLFLYFTRPAETRALTERFRFYVMATRGKKKASVRILSRVSRDPNLRTVNSFTCISPAKIHAATVPIAVKIVPCTLCKQLDEWTSFIRGQFYTVICETKSANFYYFLSTRTLRTNLCDVEMFMTNKLIACFLRQSSTFLNVQISQFDIALNTV